MSTFSGKSILVTGAASGIGLAVALHCADHGAARLILVDRDPISADFAHEAVTGDVRDETMWNRLDLAGLDHAVVNAGVAGAGTIADMSLDAWRHILSINLDGAFLTLRAAMRAMRGRGGSIVLTASAAGVKAEPGVAAYGASKAALIHLAKVAAKEGAPHGIRVNAIAPAGVETPVWDAIPMFAERAAQIGREAAFAEMAATATPLGRYAKPEEIARQIGFLLSDQSALVTGATLISDGGYTL
ncbi:SDR family NAD(P)-dependent oxidoreductase [Sphingomonas sp. Root241]|uniref:SDR family NAD(P)-dependent oxidoreductase n=1 Tax=Sphingomonas sp. Root241 TaxID=1736501 RepID=UPI0006FA796C|nr:SDR family oxidoreductase [Sphingomonas sp. Root241]KRC79865.1 oxidoreductase [Sphingomonas sp. Root241]